MNTSMKRKLCLLAAVAVALGSLSVTASARHGHLWQGRGSSLGPLEAFLGHEEREEIHAMFMSDRTKLEVLHEQLLAARKALIGKLLSPDKKIEVTRELAQLKRAREALIDERVKLALKARTIMSPQELSRASQRWTKWENLREQERSLFEEAGNHDAGEQSEFLSAP